MRRYIPLQNVMGTLTALSQDITEQLTNSADCGVLLHRLPSQLNSIANQLRSLRRHDSDSSTWDVSLRSAADQLTVLTTELNAWLEHRDAEWKARQDVEVCF